MKNENDIVELIERDERMMAVLRAVEGLGLPDAWAGAGFVRNAVWDRLDGLEAAADVDVDVVYFDGVDRSAERDVRLEARLGVASPGVRWSVKNQARMHERNGDPAYRDTADAIAHWPERCTAVAARSVGGRVELLAPVGVADLLAGIVRPTPAFAGKLDVYRKRVAAKNWSARWPRLRFEE